MKIKDHHYIKGIDGLRAFAVFAVIMYHLGFQWSEGGFFGVTVFFVISGFLITWLLMNEYYLNGKIRLGMFWLRRLRRLLPALFTVLFSITGYVFLFRPDLIDNLKEDFIAAALYVSNWWYIFENQSYFESFQSQNLLTHLWSLAIEEQFYLIWPLILIFLFAYRIQLRKIGWFILFLAIVSAGLMMFLYQPVALDRVYYGTDTRAFSLLLGAMLAVFCSSDQRFSNQISGFARFILHSFFLLSFLGLIVMCVFVSEYSPFVYYGGMVLVSVLTMILIFCILHPANRLKKIFEWAPFVWLGKRSYSLYLWHFPIIVLTTPKVHTAGMDWKLVLFQIGLTLVLTELTYQLIEHPIQRGYFFKNIKGNLRISGVIGATLFFMIGAFSTYGLIFASIYPVGTNEINPSSSVQGITVKDKSDQDDSTIVQENSSPNATSKNNQNEEQGSISEPTDDPNLQPVQKPYVDPKNDRITFIGDSIIINVDTYIHKYFKKAVVDGKVGRQMWDLAEVISRLKKENKFGDVLVLSLGTNGAFRVNQLQSLIDELKDMKQIVLVNTRVPRKWETTVNRAFRTIQKNNPEIILVDWYTASSGHDEYFVSDGVHLTKEGAQVYANLIYREIMKKKVDVSS